jgi:RecA/RadA recombinase
MSTPDFVLGDDDVAVTQTVLKQQQEEKIKETINEIEKVGKLTEEDKKKLQPKATKAKTEEEELIQIYNDLSDFIQDKVHISNDDGGSYEKLSTGIELLDAIAGGGFGIGTFSMIVGNPGTFKSALLAQTIGVNQHKYNGHILATYHDSETSMTTERLMNLGVNKPPVKPFTNVTVESVFKTIETLIAFKTQMNFTDWPILIGWDSIANTCTEKDKTTDDINSTIGLKARMLSQLFPRYLDKLKNNKIALIAVNQLREKLEMGQFSQPSDLQHMGNKDIPGGQAVKFNAFHLLFLRNRGDLKFEQYGFNGIRLEAFFVKNKFFRPYVPITLIVNFNSGISNFWTNYNFLVDTKKIQAGAWNFLLTLPEKKFRTKDAIDLYKSDSKFKEVFDKEVKETIQTEIINKTMVSTTTPT